MALSAPRGLALCRIGFGLYMISQAFDKTTKNWLSDPGPFTNQVLGNPGATPPVRGMIASAEPFYRAFLESVVAPNPSFFSQLIVIGEWVAGLSLALGLLTRLGGLTGLWLNLHYMLAKGLINNGGSIDRLFGLAEIVFILTAAGLVWGLDGSLRHSLAGNALTRWLAGLSGRETADRREPALARGS